MSDALAGFIDATLIALYPVERFRRSYQQVPDAWQVEFVSARDPFLLALCSRQVGKTSSAAVVVWDAMTRGEFVLATAPSLRQAIEFGRRVEFQRQSDPYAPALIKSNQQEIELVNSGRFVVLPSDGSTIRGYAGASIVLVDEAAFCSNATIEALMPSRAENGRILMLTTPGPTRNYLFHELWTKGSVRKIYARSVDIPRMKKKVEFDREHMPAARFASEHLLQWNTDAHSFISRDVIEEAVTHDVEAMTL